MKYVVLVVCIILLIGCNAIIGIPSDHQEQPWRYIYFFSMFLILLMPLLSISVLILSIWKSSTFQLKIEKCLNYSIIVIVLLWLLVEMSLPPRTNIRLDLFIITPVMALQLIMVVIGTIVGSRAEKTSNNQINQDK